MKSQSFRVIVLLCGVILTAALTATSRLLAEPVSSDPVYIPLVQVGSRLEMVELLDGLDSPSGLRFAPDGRLFISERITGKLLIAKQDSGGDWSLNSEPFYTFDTPKNSSGQPAPQRSGGLRDIAFDPDFANNGYIYAFYMTNTPRHNRIVRIQADPINPDLALTNSETLLYQVPFDDVESTGSHNGGAMLFGPDGKLYFTTGDGFSDADPIQSLSTYTGKVFRLNKDGTIPTDNPFYSQASGLYRAIFALGVRNPYSLSLHPQTQTIYINDVEGPNKASVYILQAGANYRAVGDNDTGIAPIGQPAFPWTNAGSAGGDVLSGGSWYPASGPLPSYLHGAYLTPLWGANSDLNGQINYVPAGSTTAVPLFEQVGVNGNGGALKPIQMAVGPDGLVYFLLSTYQTNDGRLMVIR